MLENLSSGYTIVGLLSIAQLHRVSKLDSNTVSLLWLEHDLSHSLSLSLASVWWCYMLALDIIFMQILLYSYPLFLQIYFGCFKASDTKTALNI
jgi:hypothetical protein